MVQQLNSSIKLVQIATGPFDVQNPFQQVKLVRVENNTIDKGVFGLKIGLSIEIGGFNIAEGIFFSSIEQNHVAGNDFVVEYLDNIPCPDLLPFDFFENAMLEPEGLPFIDLNVFGMSFLFKLKPLHNPRTLLLLCPQTARTSTALSLLSETKTI